MQSLGMKTTNGYNALCYKQVTGSSLYMQSRNYYKNLNNIQSLNLMINQKSNGSCFIFSTGQSFQFAASVQGDFFINQPFDFKPNKYYLISIDNNVIVWNEIIRYNN